MNDMKVAEHWVEFLAGCPDVPFRGVFVPSIKRFSAEQASNIAQLIVSLDSMMNDALA